MLSLYGADSGVLDQFVDGQPIEDSERELLWKMLYAARRFRLVEIDRWTEWNIGIDQLISLPDEFRGKLCHVQGVLEEIADEQPDADTAQRFELPRYFRCRATVGRSKAAVTVYALAVPKAWADGSPTERPRVSFRGFFVKLGGSKENAVFVAQRIAWHPSGPLGGLGMDAGLLDPIQDNTRTPITSAEREAFYQLLDCVRRAEMSRFVRLAQENVGRLRAEVQKKDPRPNAIESAVEVALFNQPERRRGELFLIEGTARRTTLVRVADADITARMGIDRYYQMEVFTAGSQGNPMIVCLRELPEGMPQGDNIYEAVRIPAFFFKKWAYRVPAVDDGVQGKPDHRLQLAPLLIARSAVWLPPEPNSPTSGLFTGLLILLLLAGVWWAVWRYTRGDRQFRRRRIAPLFEPEGGKSLDELGIETRDKPDFEGLGGR
ncbi:MAG: hypothetical protein HY000_27965 [Planctomycetes bacterium]|nr:hypothetical protein [Planctomycetota bacterium]